MHACHKHLVIYECLSYEDVIHVVMSLVSLLRCSIHPIFQHYLSFYVGTINSALHCESLVWCGGCWVNVGVYLKQSGGFYHEEYFELNLTSEGKRSREFTVEATCATNAI